MPLPKTIQTTINDYCTRDLPNADWLEKEFEFIEDHALRNRIIMEFKSIRFAYKLYEGIEASNENLIFEIRYQIVAYATIYEAILHYVLYTYYNQTKEFNNLQYHNVPVKIDIKPEMLATLNKELTHNGESIITYHIQNRKRKDTQIKFSEKCETAEKIGLIHKFTNNKGIQVDLPAEIIEIYGYRNAIHLIAEQRKELEYELDLSKRAYRRMRPFVNQIKKKLKSDKKSIYAQSR